jgi:hypothetical protein
MTKLVADDGRMHIQSQLMRESLQNRKVLSQTESERDLKIFPMSRLSRSAVRASIVARARSCRWSTSSPNVDSGVSAAARLAVCNGTNDAMCAGVHS